jgi:hypothetical protein
VQARGRGYHVDDLSIVSSLAVSSGLVSVLVLALYANSEPVQQLYRTPEVLWGILPVLLFWHSRIAILTNRGQMHDDPLVSRRGTASAIAASLRRGAVAGWHLAVSPLSLALRYVAFAVIATAGNLATQRLVLRVTEQCAGV